MALYAANLFFQELLAPTIEIGIDSSEFTEIDSPTQFVIGPILGIIGVLWFVSTAVFCSVVRSVQARQA